MRDLITDLLEGERLSAGHEARCGEPLALGAPADRAGWPATGLRRCAAMCLWACRRVAGCGACSAGRAQPAGQRAGARRRANAPPPAGRAAGGRRAWPSSCATTVRAWPDQLDRSGQAFYRPDDARQRHRRRVGLGLYLCRLVAEAMAAPAAAARRTRAGGHAAPGPGLIGGRQGTHRSRCARGPTQIGPEGPREPQNGAGLCQASGVPSKGGSSARSVACRCSRSPRRPCRRAHHPRSDGRSPAGARATGACGPSPAPVPRQRPGSAEHAQPGAGAAAFRVDDARQPARPVRRDGQVDDAPAVRRGLWGSRAPGLHSVCCAPRAARTGVARRAARRCARHHHQARGGHVEPVDDAGVGGDARTRSLEAVLLVRGHDRARPAGRRVCRGRSGRRRPAGRVALVASPRRPSLTSICTVSHSSSTSLGLWIRARAPSAKALCSISAVT